MQTLILLHGALGSNNDLDKVADVLRKENYHVLSFSFSGHGNSDFKNNFNIAQFSLELENFISDNKLITPSVIGYSMGGYVALNLALNKPSIINKIITLGTKFNWSKEVVEKETRILNPEIMLEKIPAFAKSLEAKHGANWKEVVFKTADLMWDIHRKNYLNSEALKTISNKVLIGLGDKDQLVTFEETINVYRTLPNANMYVLPYTKHQIELLDIELFAETIKSFLKN